MPAESFYPTNRLELLERMIARLHRRSIYLETISGKYWTVRRVLFVGSSLLALFACGYSGTKIGVALAAVFLTVFLVVAFYHRRVQDSIRRTSLMAEIKQVQLARIQLDWDHLPLSEDEEKHESRPETAHPFESDLDVTGERSLLRLLDSSITKEGSQRLRSWLMSVKPEPLVVEKRQSLVRELSRYALFRDKLQLLSALAGQDAKSSRGGRKDQAGRSRRWKSGILVDWITQGVSERSLGPTVLLLAALAVLNITLIVLAFLGLIPQVWPILIGFIIYWGAMIVKQSRIVTAWDELQELENALSRFSPVFQYLEARRFKHTPGLAEICAPFSEKEKTPSVEFRKLERLAAALGLRTNALLWLLVNALVPWDFYFTHRLELIKKDLAQLFPGWLNAWYELEALNSLANFAYLNPAYVYPTILPRAADASLKNRQSSIANTFNARELGHPLLRPGVKVCNDFALGEHQKIVVLTGSNMAGKSTFLRTVGANLCLAYAGAPVNAASLETSLFRVFTCIKVSDSVQDGLSYFYAEVKRLKALLAATEAVDPLPVLFLIDEIFRGTNSRERRIGSRAYIRALSQRKEVGLVATHDLELVKLADEISGVVNLHFREEVRDGRMIFDYKLRPGPCPTTNALEIIRLEGLPTEDCSDA